MLRGKKTVIKHVKLGFWNSIKNLFSLYFLFFYTKIKKENMYYKLHITSLKKLACAFKTVSKNTKLA